MKDLQEQQFWVLILNQFEKVVNLMSTLLHKQVKSFGQPRKTKITGVIYSLFSLARIVEPGISIYKPLHSKRSGDIILQVVKVYSFSM